MALELLADGYTFIEAPRVDARNNLYFSDIVLGGVYRRAPDGKIDHLIPDRTWIGGLALNADGRLVLSGRGGLVLFDPQTGRRETLFDTLDGVAVGSINDIQPDGNGGLYAGMIDPAAQVLAKAEPQPLVHIAPDRRARRVAEGIKVTNGIGLSPDGRTLYQAETLEGVLAYDRASDGTLTNRRLVIQHPLTDGLAIDAEGCVWIAAPTASAVVRFSPDGTLDRRIETPVRETTSLTFGGEDLRDLYIVTGSRIDLPAYERTGRVYRMRSDVAGLPTPLTRF
jgi:sugar lactone lactonase YvrE